MPTYNCDMRLLASGLLVILSCSPTSEGVFQNPEIVQSKPCEYNCENHFIAVEPCEQLIRLTEFVENFRTPSPLSASELKAFDLLVKAEGESTSFFIWGDENGEMADPGKLTKALWLLMGSRDPEPVFVSLFLGSRLGSTGQFAALIGMRASSESLYSDAALHFEHTGAHFTFFMYPADLMCGTPWFDWQKASIGTYIDGLYLAEYKERWKAQVSRSDREVGR